MIADVRVVRKKGSYQPGPDAYAVVKGGVLIGRVRITSSYLARGEWTAAVWLKDGGARSLEPIEGNFRFRRTAVDAVVAAWNDDNE